MENSTCKKCGNKFPTKRKEMGYNVCTDCSTEQSWSCSALTYHKTGNTIEVIKDPETAYNINQMASRKNYGVASGVTGNYRKFKNEDGPKKEPKRIDMTGHIYSNKLASKGTLNGKTQDFEKQGAMLLSILDSEGLESAKNWLKNEYTNLRLSQKDFVKLGLILKTIKIEETNELSSGELTAG